MPTTVHLCEKVDCVNLMSQAGVDLRTDDKPTTITDCIEEGSAYVAGILAALYTPEDLAAVPLMKYIARFFACCAIFRRRGEGIPSAWEEQEKKYDALLMKYATGELALMSTPQPPGGPAVSNVEYDLESYPQGGVSRPRSYDRANPARRLYSNGRTYQGPR